VCHKPPRLLKTSSCRFLTPIQGLKSHFCIVLALVSGVLVLFWTTDRPDNDFFNSLDRSLQHHLALFGRRSWQSFLSQCLEDALPEALL
jgi:hypothetical protein